MEAQQRAKVAAVGLGWVTLNRHLAVMDPSPSIEVVGVIDRRPGLAREVSRRRGYRRYAETDDLAAVDWLEEVDAVTIGTAPFAHHPLAMQALGLGKHVLTEKPFAMSPGEGAELAATAAERRRALGVVHNFQFARSTLALLRDMERGRLGRIRSVSGTQLGNPRRRLPAWYDDLPLGLFYDESPHLLYLLDRVAGAPLAVRGVDVVPSTTGKRTPAHLHATFTVESADLPVSLHCNFESPISEWHLLVLGEDGAGIVDIFRDIYIRLPNDTVHTSWPVLRTSLFATAQHWAQHLTSGIGHLAGRLTYGNPEVFARFAAAVLGRPERLAPIDSRKANQILGLQHAIIERA